MKCAIVIACLAGTAHADRPWALGLAVDGLGVPAGHLGIPLGGTHLAPSLYARRALDEQWSFTADLGLATAQGMALSLGGEYRYAVASRVDVFGGLALQTGFAGPDYYARHDDEFVGYAYAASGTFSLGLRAAAGARLRFAHAEVSLAAIDVLAYPIAPHGDAALDDLFSVQLSAGVRF